MKYGCWLGFGYLSWFVVSANRATKALSNDRERLEK